MSTNWDNIKLPSRGTGADLITALLSGIEGYQQGSAAKQKSNYEAMMGERQRKAYEEAGIDPNLSSLDPQVQKLLMEISSQPDSAENNPVLSAIDELESLVNSSGIGFLAQINPSGKARYNRGKFKALQARLLPLFKSFFPQGMSEKEFIFVQENYLPQPGDSEQKIRGKLQGLRELAGGRSNLSMADGHSNRPPLESFYNTLPPD